MALPELEIKGSRFTLKALMKELGERVGELFAPLNLNRKKKNEGPEYKGAPGPMDEWEDVQEEPRGKGLEVRAVTARKGFPSKEVKMGSKRMHRPRIRKPEINRGKSRGKLQKNL